MSDDLHAAMHQAAYIAEKGHNMKRWLSELEKIKRDAGQDFIAGCIRSDIVCFENACEQIRKK